MGTIVGPKSQLARLFNRGRKNGAEIMTFENLKCIARDGATASMYSPTGENIFVSESAEAVMLRNTQIVAIRWEYDGLERSVSFGYIGSATLDRASGLLVIALHFSNSFYKRPANAIAINPDGSLNHIIEPPAFVLLQEEKSAPAERYPVEAISEVLEKNGRTLIGLNYQYEKVERRFYDPALQRWMERDQIYRK